MVDNERETQIDQCETVYKKKYNFTAWEKEGCGFWERGNSKLFLFCFKVV